MYIKDFMSDELRKSFKDISSSLSKTMQDVQNAMSSSMSRLNESIDWEYVKELDSKQKENVLKMAKYGWTISPNMGFGDHMLVKDIDSLEEIDEIFIHLYLEEDRHALYLQDVKYIENHISEQHKELFVQCVENFENGKFVISIPSLLSLLEGTIASMFKTPKRKLLDQFEESRDKDSEFLIETAKLSISNLLNKYLFKGHEFSDERLDGLNRHWVLHGRDDVRLWKKVDALKLINNLSTVLFVRENAFKEQS